MDEATFESMRRLAARLEGDPHYMAYVLASYRLQEGLDERGLCQRLAAPPEMITRLSLCKRPDDGSPFFAQQVTEISEYAMIDSAALRVLLAATPMVESPSHHSAAATSASPARRSLLSQNPTDLGIPARVRHIVLAFAKPAIIVATVGLVIVTGSLLYVLRPPHAGQIATVGNNEKATNESGSSPQASAPSETAEATRAGGSRPANANSPEEVAGSESIARSPQSSSGQNPRGGMAIASLSVNLDDYAVLREADDARRGAEREIKLTTRLTRLRLTLPEGSSRGTYHVAMVGAFGEAKIEQYARSTDGRTLVFSFDLSTLRPSRYHLCLSRSNEVPDCYAVILAAKP